MTPPSDSSRFFSFLMWMMAVLAMSTEASDFGYQITKNVKPYLELSYDVRDMRATTDATAKQQIYQSGRSDPERTGDVTLQSLSLTASQQWSKTPLYQIYRQAFHDLGVTKEADQEGSFDGSPVSQYADTLVQDMFELNIAHTEATGAVVLNVMQAYWGFLWQVLTECQNSNVDGAVAALDTAFALYVGEGQSRGEASKGYMIYNLAEFIDERFGQDEGESEINSQVIETFLFLKSDLGRGYCTASASDGYKSLRDKVRLLYTYSNTVLVQFLLYQVQEVENTGSSDLVELFSLAVLPQVASCDVEAYETLISLAVLSDVTADTQGDVVKALQKTYNCFSITCKDVGAYLDTVIPECNDNEGALAPVAEYVPRNDVRLKSYIDRDMLQMSIFMKAGAWEVAEDFYRYGWNTDFSLREMATNSLEWTGSGTFDLYKNYYQQQNYNFFDEVITNALQGKEYASNASPEQRYAVVQGILQAAVMYLGVVGQATNALVACENGNANKALSLWDGAVAVFVGSIEGEEKGGIADGGQSLYAVSKKFCVEFGTCEPQASVTDIVLMQLFQLGATALSNGECNQARTKFEGTIAHDLLVPIIQGVLFHTREASIQPDSSSQGSLLAYTRVILPVVNAADSTSTVALSTNSNYFATGGTRFNIDLAASFAAFQSALPKINSELCQKVGTLMVNKMRTGVCPGDEPPLLPAPTSPQTAGGQAPTRSPIYVPQEPHPGGLAWGRYKFVNEPLAIQDSLFSLDVRRMWDSTTADEARQVYSAADTSSATGGLSGTVDVRTLQDFSTKAYEFMSEDPIYNFFRVALFADESFDSDPSTQQWNYGDTVEELALGPDNGNSAQLASEAAIVMNIWMMISHKLYESVRQCKQRNSAAEYIDSAVGLWIGQEQGEGKFNSGWMMYNVGQDAAKNYGFPETEAKVNTGLMDLFVEAQATALSCQTSDTAFVALRLLVEEIMRNLAIPLVQQLLFHMSDDNFEYVELYALSFVPQSLSCDQGIFEELENYFLEGFRRDTSVNDDLKSRLAKVFHCMRISCEDLGDTSKSSNAYLKSLVADICTKMNDMYDSNMLATYRTTADVKELARIDLDVLQIDLFMLAGAYELALEVYQHGRNSRLPDGSLQSLQGLARSSQNADAGNLWKLYEAFFADPFYADTVVTDAIKGEGRFGQGSRFQRAEAVQRAFQTMIPYLQIISRLREALTICTQMKPVKAQTKVDEAAALYVGSIEGPISGGSKEFSGQMMFDLAKEVCSFYDKCDNLANAKANSFILFGFENMKGAIASDECDSATEILEKDILGMLPVPLVQASLYFSVMNMGEAPESGNLVAGDIVTETIVPQIAEVDETKALFIYGNANFPSDQQTAQVEPEEMFEAFKSVLRGMGVDCRDVGTLESAGLSVCDDTVIAPHPETPTSLGGGKYITTTYVKDRADIALDIKEMIDELTMGKVEFAQDIYRSGKNSPVFDEEGKKVDTRSLAGFSTEASGTMSRNPLYQITVFALRDENDMYLGTDASLYADSVVNEAFVAGAESKSTLAAEAAVALNLWMELANELFQTATNCKNGILTDQDGIHSIDEAAAYWIGDAHPEGDEDEGHLLYALAERMGEHFGIKTSDQSRTNMNLMRLFNEVRNEVSFPSACKDIQIVRRVRVLVDKITSLMVVVNVQALIHYLRTDDRERVRIYAHAFVPLVASCSPVTYGYLKENLLDAPYGEADIERIIVAIRSTFPCFNITCEDVGIHFREVDSACADPILLRPLAGYRPASDVREYAQMDLDILELDILMQMGSYEAAEDLYSFGKHSSVGVYGDGTALSLKYLATSSGRSAVPQFDAFRNYFGNDDKYADTLIREALDTKSGMGFVQRWAIVVGGAQYMVMYMAALQAMRDAVDDCSSDGSTGGPRAATNWDKVAAYLIGHLEGAEEGGSREGRLTWALSKEFCAEFGNCSGEETRSSVNNDMIATLLYSGRGAVLSGSCGEVREVIQEVASLIQVPLIQASLSTAGKLTRGDTESKELLQAEAYVFAHSLLPLIQDLDRDAATVISSNFPLTGKAVHGGLSAVASAYASVIPGLGVNCENVGTSSTVNACTGEAQSSADSKKVGLIVGILLISVCVVGIVFLMRCRRRKKLHAYEKPELVPSNGELNHTSDLLARTAEESLLWNNADSIDEVSDDDYIDALCSALPEKEQYHDRVV